MQRAFANQSDWICAITVPSCEPFGGSSSIIVRQDIAETVQRSSLLRYTDLCQTQRWSRAKFAMTFRETNEARTEVGADRRVFPQQISWSAFIRKVPIDPEPIYSVGGVVITGKCYRPLCWTRKRPIGIIPDLFVEWDSNLRTDRW